MKVSTAIAIAQALIDSESFTIQSLMYVSEVCYTLDQSKRANVNALGNQLRNMFNQLWADTYPDSVQYGNVLLTPAEQEARKVQANDDTLYVGPNGWE